MIQVRTLKTVWVSVIVLITLFSFLGWIQSRKNYHRYPDWLREALQDPQSAEQLNALPVVIAPVVSTHVDNSFVDLGFLRLICKPEDVSVVNRSAGQGSSVAVDFHAYGVCVVKKGEDAGKYQDPLNYEWQKASLLQTISELNRFGVWKKADEDYLAQINAKRFRCLFGSEMLLYEADNLKAIVMFAGAGRSQKQSYRLFDYGGKFSETSFLCNAVLYDKSGKARLSMAFYFDQRLTTKEAKSLIAEFLTAIRM